MVSVVMAVYNGRKYLREQLESICIQTCKVDEIILIDDKSFETVLDIIDNIQEKYGIQIKYYVNEKNIGYAQTFFAALKESSGTYIFFSDQDDIWDINKVKHMINAMTNNQSMLCLSALNIIINGNGKIRKKEKKIGNSNLCKIRVEEVLRQKRLRPGMSLLINNKLKDKILNYDISRLRQHDRFIEFIASLEDGFYILNENLTKYRIHDHNVSGMNLTLKLRDNFEGRINQVDREITYLENLKIIGQYGAHIDYEIDELLHFYLRRKIEMQKNVINYFTWGIVNLNKFPSKKIFIGDLIAKMKGF